MSFLPDVDEHGRLKEVKEPARYTPPQAAVEGVRKPGSTELHNDRAGKPLRYVDGPTMANMHECVPDSEHQCVTCRREMLV